MHIRTDVVTCNIPLLLSRSSMKKAEIIIDLNNDTAIIFGKRVKLGVTTMGHYTLPIFYPPTNKRIELVLVNSIDSPNRKNVDFKLHKQFALPSSEKLKKNT